MALANKYRPKSFSEVIGQDNAVVALRNIIKNKNKKECLFGKHKENVCMYVCMHVKKVS